MVHNTKKALYRKGWLSLERISKLNEIGFVWDARGAKVQHHNNNLEDDPIDDGDDDEGSSVN